MYVELLLLILLIVIAVLLFRSNVVSYLGSGNTTGILPTVINDFLDLPRTSYIYFRRDNADDLVVKFNNVSDDELTIDTPYMIGSITKVFISIGLLIALAENKLTKLLVGDYITGFKDKIIETGTIYDLLNHRSGIGRIEPESFTRNEFDDLSAVLKRIMAVPRLVTGSPCEYMYSNINYIIAGAILEAITGKPWHVYLTEKIFSVAQMYKTRYDTKCLSNTYVNFSPPRHLEPNECDRTFASSAYGLQSTISDLVLFAEFLPTLLAQYGIVDQFSKLYFVRSDGNMIVNHSGYVYGTRSYFKTEYSSDSVIISCYFINITAPPKYVW